MSLIDSYRNLDTITTTAQGSLATLFKSSTPTAKTKPPTSLKERFPVNWKKKEFESNGKKHQIMLAPAAVERARIIYVSGLNSSPLFFEKEIKPLQKIGISVHGFALPDPDQGTDLIKDLKTPVKDLLFDKNSPVYDNLRPDVPVYIVTHSTGGLIFTDLSFEPELRQFMEENFSGAIHISPFFDTANASLESSELSSALYMAYTHAFGWVRSGVLPPDKLYYKMHKFPIADIDSSSYKDPYHWQIRYLKKYGISVVQKAKELSEDLDYTPLAIPQSIISGVSDPCACPLTERKMADLLWAELLELDCMHNPLQQQFEKAITKIANDVGRCTPQLGNVTKAIDNFYDGPNRYPAIS